MSTVLKLRIPILLFFGMDTQTINAVRFLTIGGQHIVAAAEVNTQQSLPFDFHIQRMQVPIITNTKDGVSVFNFRDDGVDVGAIVSIPAGTTGLFTSAILDTTVLRNSLFNVRVDTSLSSAGNLQAPVGQVLGYVRQEDLGPVGQ